jgi:hypothetical protein
VATVIHRFWLWPVKLAIEIVEVSVTLERDNTRAFSHIPMRRSRVEKDPEI